MRTRDELRLELISYIFFCGKKPNKPYFPLYWIVVKSFNTGDYTVKVSAWPWNFLREKHVEAVAIHRKNERKKQKKKYIPNIGIKVRISLDESKSSVNILFRVWVNIGTCWKCTKRWKSATFNYSAYFSYIDSVFMLFLCFSCSQLVFDWFCFLILVVVLLRIELEMNRMYHVSWIELVTRQLW